MIASTIGIEVRARSRALRDAVELISSMQFSISLLTVICIASVIGTVVKQHDPYSNYVNQFGPFWAEFFAKASPYTVYSAWWFLLILAFLVLSTSLCIARNAPKISADLRSYKEQVREQALVAFHHKGQAELAEIPVQAFERIWALLRVAGWKTKVQVRKDGERERGTMIAARRGAANKLGYIAAHSAIVLVCVRGLFDGDLVVRAQMALQGKSSFSGGGMMRDVPAANRIGPATPTFRANLLLRPALISSHRPTLSEVEQGGVSHGNFGGTRTQGNAGCQGAERASRTPRTTPPAVCAGGVYGR